MLVGYSAELMEVTVLMPGSKEPATVTTKSRVSSLCIEQNHQRTKERQNSRPITYIFLCIWYRYWSNHGTIATACTAPWSNSSLICNLFLNVHFGPLSSLNVWSYTWWSCSELLDLESDTTVIACWSWLHISTHQTLHRSCYSAKQLQVQTHRTDEIASIYSNSIISCVQDDDHNCACICTGVTL